jgi:CheY-like chemotaxis protein
MHYPDRPPVARYPQTRDRDRGDGTGTLASPTPKQVRRCDDQRVAESVLVVDDDPAFLGLVARILSDLGIESVTTAADASQALLVAEEARPAAVLVDIGLPDRDGTDLAYELSDRPWQPRVVLTSSDSEAFLAIDPRDGRRKLAFIAKEDFAGDTLRRALLDG